MFKRLQAIGLVLICALSLLGFGAILPVQAAEMNRDSESVPPGLEIEAERFQAVIDCLPEELGLAGSDPGSRIAQVFGEWGKDQFERAVGLTDHPQLTEAEQKFESCLEAKGITPMRKLQQESYL